MYRWQQAAGRRHAYTVTATQTAHIQPNAEFETLCGKTVTPKQSDVIDCGGHWFDPTCTVCHDILLYDSSTVGVS